MSTPLQLFVKSTFFNFIGYCFILLNCFVLALYTPLVSLLTVKILVIGLFGCIFQKKEAYYLKVLNLFVDVSALKFVTFFKLRFLLLDLFLC